ncbi:MAG: hypothetical protein IJ683_04210 [Butyrivibrio sp.]|nr:hypothetical protein [Butyrivibrio sp.]MBR1641511.1 hypothetical protein [Butyrivibrio sp.]
MVITILSWIYIFIISIVTGLVINKILSRFIPVPSYKECSHFGLTGLIVTGLVTLTVYAEVFSIFYKVGAVCHILMLVLLAIGVYFYRPELLDFFKMLKDVCLRSGRNLLIVYVLVILAGAFFSSNGTFHTDTGIYHAQAIRMLEEYGVLKGLGNLQLHFAYNSSYLPLCALFTMSFILPFPLHSMTGFFMVLFSCYAVSGLAKWKEHEHHGGDLARVAILVYALTNMTGLQSPATDYGTMFFTLYIMCCWIAYAQESGAEDDRDKIALYGYLAVLSIFAVSMKLSAALLILLAIFPAILLVKKKMFKEFGIFLLIGFLSFLPYMIRNVILSGWLFYPVASIDLFNVVWKIPAEYMKVDSDQIKVWGRCLYDITRINDGVTTWFPIWWAEKQHYEVMLIYSQFVGAVILVITSILRLREKKIDLAMVIFYLTIIANLVLWFFTAPFIRYGLAFLLLLPLCAFGDMFEYIVRKKSIVLGLVASLVLINFCSWIDDYFMDDMVFVKHNIMEGHYIVPVPFDEGNMTAVDMDGLTVYVAGADEINSYYTCPGSCYSFMVERTKLIGDDISKGFMPR